MATPPTEPQPYVAAPQAESHLWDYVHVLLRRRRVVLAIFTAVFALATLRTLLTRPVYEGTAQILIERADPSVLNFKEVAQLDSQRDDYYQTQYKLLQSRSLARRVVDQLNLLSDPEYGGPRDKAQIDAILAQPQGQSREMENVIDAFLRPAQRPPDPQQPPRDGVRRERPPRARRRRHERPRQPLHRAEPRPALPDLLRGRPLARHPDRRAAEQGRAARPPAPGREAEGGPRQHRGAPHSSSTSASRSSAPPSTSARPSGSRRRPSIARWRAPPTPRSCPR